MKLPAFLDARRLEGRIVRLFLVLLLVVQLASFLLVRQAIEAQAIKAIDGRLISALRILSDELSRRLDVEYIKSSVLTADFGFRTALGQLNLDAAGPATVIDAVDNQAARSRARLAAFVDLDGKVLASQPQARQMVAAAQQLPEGEPAAQADLRLAIVDGEPLQLLRVPARAPGPVGQVVFAYALPPELLVPIKQYTNVDVAVGVRRADGRWMHTVHVEDLEGLPELLAAAGASAEPGAQLLRWQGQALRARLFELPALGNGEAQRVGGLLWASLDQEMAPARELQKSLLLLNLAGVGLFALGSVFTARRITGPIQALRGFAERLGSGDYDSPVQTHTRLTEVAGLARAFESMRLGIRKHQAEIEHYAYWDRLTGLPNRSKFIERLRQQMEGSNEPLALLVLNLDRFKPVNDALGRELGDRLLQQVAQRLQPSLGAAGPDHSLLARLGGDEFAILLAGCGAEQALLAAREIHVALEQPLRLERRSVPREGSLEQLNVDVSASIGIALYPDHGHEPDDLIALAERAMDLAKKRQGRRAAVRAQHGCAQPGVAGSAVGAATRGGREPAPAVPSTQAGFAEPGRACRRSLGALAASGARHGAAGDVHPVRRGDRLRTPAHPVGAAGVGKACGRRAGEGAATSHQRQPQHPRPAGRRADRQGSAHARRRRLRARMAVPGDHRERDHGRPQAGVGNREGASRGWLPPGD